MHRIAHTNRFLFATLTIIAIVMPAMGQVINEDHKLVASDGSVNDDFGWAISYSGNTMVVGVPEDSDNGVDSGSAYVFTISAGVWTQQAKLLPDDGEAGALFGISVSISGDTVIIGAIEDTDPTSEAGSVYVFTRSVGVWTQQAKLIPLGEFEDTYSMKFGRSVSLSGDTALIGADKGSLAEPEPFSGAAYIYTRSGTAWSHQVTFHGDALNNTFGQSVFLDGDSAIVGDPNDDENGASAGSVKVFTRSEGMWSEQAKILPLIGASGDDFGCSVCIGGDTAVIGARNADGNGTASGSAYVFTRSGNTWIQQDVLLPSDGEAYQFFGTSVSISGEVAVVGAHGDASNGMSSGAAYVFKRDGLSWTQQVKLLASDGETDDQLAGSVSLQNNTVVIGAKNGNGNVSDSGAAYVFNLVDVVDSDGDGLLDDWENNGIPYTDINGVEKRFLLPDADPNHKDLYVEVDAMAGFALSNGADLQLVLAYDNAPLENPDGSTGITLHILHDETTLPYLPIWDTDGCWPLDFENFKANSFGTFNERANVNYSTLLEAKARAYRYCIVADQADDPTTPGLDDIGGCGSMPGDNFVMFIGTSNGNIYGDEGQAAIFMHELGHNLGLGHGGGDGINGKPNYPSIMNYLLAFKTSWNSDFWSLDYSRADAANLLSLNESSLNENASVGSANNFYSDYFMPYGVNVDRNGTTTREIRYIALDGSTADFGDTSGTMFQDGQQDPGVAQDLNYVTNPPADISLPSTPSAGQILESYDDWANVGLGLLAGVGSSTGAPVFPTGELTEAAVAWMDTNFPSPPRPCPADLTGNGTLNFFDISAFLTLFAANDPIADFNSDGTWNFFDISAFLEAFAAGCP